MHTRQQGPRPEGFVALPAPTRERKPLKLRAPRALAAAPVAAPAAQVAARAYRDACVQTDISLTNFPASPAGKRRREDDNGRESPSKRARSVDVFSEPPPGTPFYTPSNASHSIILRSRAPITIRDSDHPSRQKSFKSLEDLQNSSYYDQILKPEDKEKLQSVAAEEDAPETPQPAKENTGYLSTVKKFIGYLTGSPAKAQTSTTPQIRKSPLPPRRIRVSPTPDREIVPPRPKPRPDSYATALAFAKRHRINLSESDKAIMAASARKQQEEEEVEFTTTPGTLKRKLASVDGKIPRPKSGGFGIDDSYLDVDNEVEGVDGVEESEQPETPVTTNIFAQPQTPLRSALRQNNTIGRSTKSVRINPTTDIKNVYPYYGPAGQYTGSLFSDSPANPNDTTESTVSSTDPRSILSPNTLQNASLNQTPRFRLDTNVFDPNDRNWRPSLANPSPGHFRLPEADEYDDFDSSEEALLEKEQKLRQEQPQAPQPQAEAQEQGQQQPKAVVQEHTPVQPPTETQEQAQVQVQTQEPEHEQEQVPVAPSTPRMTHAELPQSSPPSTISTFAGHTDSIILNDTQEIIGLSKARSDAQKYKPARSSRLSHSEPARSRSSSPPATEDDDDFTQSKLLLSTPGNFQPRGQHLSPYETIMSEQSLNRDEPDTIEIGEDGMTEYQREHQHDDWARNVFANIQVQTYEEAGVASPYIAELLRRNWMQRDTDESVSFWIDAFTEGIRAEQEAREQGYTGVEWVSNPSAMEE